MTAAMPSAALQPPAHPPEQRGKCAHVITDLAVGGAEKMLRKCVTALRGEGWGGDVCALMPGGKIADALRRDGVSVATLGLRAGQLPRPSTLLRLRRWLRSSAPQVIQGWMYHGNLAATIGAASDGQDAPVVWNVRQTLYDLRNERRLTRAVIRASVLASRSTRAIVYNSRVSAKQHEALGFAAARTVVIPNGFELDKFAPDPDARAAVRRELGLQPDTRVVGLVTRFHPMKDHGGMLRAAAEVVGAFPDARFLLCGRGVEAGNAELTAAVNALDLKRHVVLLGERDDPARINAALDVALSTSAWGEGFPNSIGEAMACGVPCVVTDVGDSAWVVDDTGRSVPARDPEALARSIIELLQLPSDDLQRLGARARERIRGHFSLQAVTRNYADLYSQVTH